MKPIKVILSILFLFQLSSFGQPPHPTYHFFIKQADSLLQTSEYKQAGLFYNKAFKVFNNKGLPEDRYKAARAWSLASENDSAFNCLERLITKRYYVSYEKVINESDFKNISSDKRWNQIIDTLKVIKTISGPPTTRALTTFALKNKLKKPIDVYYYDYYHNEIFYFDLKPKQTKQQESYIGNVWIIRLKHDSSQVLEFMIRTPNQKFDTNGQIPNNK